MEQTYKHTSFSRSENILIIENLPPHSSNQEIKEYLLSLSIPVDKVKVVYRKTVCLNFCGVTLTNDDHFDKAIKKIDQRKWRGTILKCRKANENDTIFFMVKRQKKKKKKSNKPIKSIDLDEIKFAYCIDCEVAYMSSEECPPLEIGIVKIDISRKNPSIMEKFHKFIDVGDIPMEFIHTANYSRKNIHSIPSTNFSHAEKNYVKIAKEILTFLGIHETSKTEDCILIAKGPHAENKALEWIWKKANMEHVPLYIYDLKDFIRTYDSSVKEEEALKFVQSALEYLHKEDKCSYHYNISHKFHCALEDAVCNGRFLIDLIKRNFIVTKEEYVPRFDLQPSTEEEYKSVSALWTKNVPMDFFSS